MSVSAVILLLSISTSWAGTPVPGVDIADDPCPTTPPGPEWRMRVGYSKNRGQAGLAEARQNARDTLLTDLTNGYGETRRNAVRRHIFDWKEGRVTKEGACAAVAVEARYLDAFETDAAALDRNLSRLAERVKASLGTQPVHVKAPTWDTGCGAGDVGRYLSAALRNELATHGVNPQTANHPSFANLSLQLAPGPLEVVVTATLTSSKGALALPGLSFAADLLNVEPDDARECRSDDALGLDDGERLGAEGLRVWVDLPTRDGIVCEGETVDVTFRVNQPARVQVYSVDLHGNGYLVWPPPNGRGDVEDSVTLSGIRMARFPAGGDERLVAVAVPAGSRFGRNDTWHGFCRLADAFGPTLYTSESAIGASTYVVVPAGSSGCPVPRDLADMYLQVEGAKTALPCGSGR